MDARATQLGERVKAFIRNARADTFEALALDIFAHQHARNAPYRRLCASRGASPNTVTHWSEIPPVPAEAFKRAVLTCEPARVVFQTSGTREGSGSRGAHHVADPGIYELSLAESVRRFVLPDADRIRIVSLVPSLEEQPDSSLSYMANEMLERFGTAGSCTCVNEHRLLLGDLFSALDRATVDRVPVLLVGTTIALATAMEAADEAGLQWALAPRSRLMDTGGSKGSGRTFDERALLDRYGDVFGLPPDACVNEYGMTEMLSQLYNADLAAIAASGWRDAHPSSAVDRRVKVTPHWVRSRVVDPETLADADEGVVCHLDLANCHSVSAILTEDVGRRSRDGLVLLGRRLGAETRGCSIAMDEWLQ